MKLRTIKFLGFDGVSDGPVVLDPQVTLLVGAVGRGKSRLLSLIEATAGELVGRPMSRAFLRGTRGKVTVSWEVAPAAGEPPVEGESEIFVGDQPARPAGIERDLGLRVAKSCGLSARVHDAADAKLGESFAQALVDHQLGVARSEQVERFTDAIGAEAGIALTTPKRDGRQLVPVFRTADGDRSFSELSRSGRSRVALAAAVCAGEPLVLIDDVHMLDARTFGSVLAARHPSSQLVLTSSRELEVPLFLHSLD